MPPRVRLHAAALAGFLVLAALASWPLPLHLADAFTGAPSGDTGVYVWNTWVFQHEIEQGRLPFYTRSILTVSPDDSPVNLSLHNYTTFANLLAWPLTPLTGLVAAFNLVFLLNVALSGYAAFLLARDLTGRDAESWIAGALFALSPVLVARSVGHFSLVAAAPLPIFLLLLRRVSHTRALRHSIGLGAVVAWATFSDAYYGVFCLAMGGMMLIAQLVRVHRSTDTPVSRVLLARRLLDVVIVLVAGFVLAMLIRGGGPVVLLGIRVSMRTLYTPMLVLTVLVLLRIAVTVRPRLDLRRDGWSLATLRVIVVAMLAMIVPLAPVLYAFGERLLAGNGQLPPTLWRSSPPGVDLLAFLLPNPTHPLWGDTMVRIVERWAGRGDAYPEFVASQSYVALAVLALAWLKGGWRPSRPWLAFTGTFGLLALGPFLHVAGVNTQMPMPWSLLRYVPILGMVRSPTRFSVLATLGVAMLFALALAWLTSRHPHRRRLLLAAVVVAGALELVPVPRTLYSAGVPALYDVIANDPRQDIRVLELPLGVRDGASSLGDFNPRTQYFQTAHGKRIVGGYLSRVAPSRKRNFQRLPVLNALVTLSEGEALTPGQESAARAAAEAFLRRMRIGYVVIDHTRATPELVAFASDILSLREIRREVGLTLYVPQPPSPPAR